MLPGVDGTHRNSQELSEFPSGVRLSLDQLEEVQATFFELSSGEMRGQPAVGHSPNILASTSAEINGPANRHRFFAVGVNNCKVILHFLQRLH